MYEVERKVRLAHADVRDRLGAVEADYVGSVHQRDVYFAHPDRDFSTTDEALRVRRQRALEGSLDVPDRLTYKGPRLDGEAKTRLEREATLGDADAVIFILERLDFAIAGIVEKTRERYHAHGCEICLDAVEGLGEFVEIEATRSDVDIETAERETRALADELGIDEADTVASSYLTMLLDRDDAGS